jgi:hypothetical protein
LKSYSKWYQLGNKMEIIKIKTILLSFMVTILQNSHPNYKNKYQTIRYKMTTVSLDSKINFTSSKLSYNLFSIYYFYYPAIVFLNTQSGLTVNDHLILITTISILWEIEFKQGLQYYFKMKWDFI